MIVAARLKAINPALVAIPEDPDPLLGSREERFLSGVMGLSKKVLFHIVWIYIIVFILVLGLSCALVQIFNAIPLSKFSALRNCAYQSIGTSRCLSYSIHLMAGYPVLKQSSGPTLSDSLEF
jgi:hypothetical protein